MRHLSSLAFLDCKVVGKVSPEFQSLNLKDQSKSSNKEVVGILSTKVVRDVMKTGNSLCSAT